MKRILIICGTGIATSTVVAAKVREHLAETGMVATIDQGKVMDLLRGDINADLIVATTDVPASVQIPVIRAIALLTGIGEEEVYAQIDALLA